MFALAALPILALLGVGIAVATRSSSSSSSPAPRPYTPGGSFPATPTPTELTYFDIQPNGVRVWKEPYRSQILAYLEQWGVVPAVQNDLTTVQLVPKKTPADASARQWLQQFGGTRHVLACRWLYIQHALLPKGQAPAPEFLRAVAPGEEAGWAGPTSNAMYAVLQWQAPQQAPNIPGGVVPPPAPVPAPPPPAGQDAFASLSPELAAELRAMVRETQDPTKLVLMADTLEGRDPKNRAAAEALRKRAEELRLEQETRAIRDGRIYIVRPNELQSEIAQWFTGNANRWRELSSTNPQLTLMRDGAVEYFAPWVAGQKVILPVGWNAQKGLPPRKPRAEPRAA